jgi:hypothetical protein
MKFTKDGVTIEAKDPNTFSAFERYGFVREEEEDEEGKEELIERAKALGIKVANNISIEKLKEKIAKIESEGE